MLLYKLLAVRKYINNDLEKEFIRLSNSFTVTLILVPKKPGNKIRIYINYRNLNNNTARNRYLIPLIRKTLNALYSARIFTKLDIVTAFNRLYIVPGNE